MQIKEFLNSVCEQIKYKPIRQEISEEMENHIEELKENYIADGLDEKIAEEQAVKQMGNAEEIGKKLNKVHKPKLDWRLLIISAVLICFGFLVAFIKTSNTLTENSEINYFTKYLLFVCIGIIMGTIIYFIDYKKISKYSNIIYIIATILIVLTVTNGCQIYGKNYMRLGNISISISIIAVPLYIISFVGFLNNINIKKTIVLSIISLLMLTTIPSIASAFVLGVIYLIISTAKIIELKENKLKRITLLWGTVIILGMVMIILYTGLAPYRINRFTSAFNPESDPDGSGWLGINRKLIINSAQTFGEAEDMSNALELFDEGTNFAFISILAHYGWIISLSMVIAVIVLSAKLIINSIKLKDVYGKLLTIGISSMFILQSVFNILMNLNLWIEADFNIPFVSYGGVNLIINIMCLALVLSIYRRKDIIIRKVKKDEVETV